MGKHSEVYPEEGMRRCGKCHKVWPATAEYFNRNKRDPSGLFCHCKECSSSNFKERYQNDREAIIAKQIVANRSSLLVNINGYRVKPGAPCTLTRTEWVECIDFFNGLDAYTGRPMVRLAMDHVIPLSKGGGHEKYNVIPCDGPINMWKRNYDMEEWYRKEFFFDEDRLARIKEWTNGGLEDGRSTNEI